MAFSTLTGQRAPRRGPRLFERLSHLRQLRKERRALREFDNHRLDDIGLSRDQADAEAKRPIWDPPAHWRR